MNATLSDKLESNDSNEHEEKKGSFMAFTASVKSVPMVLVIVAPLCLLRLVMRNHKMSWMRRFQEAYNQLFKECAKIKK
jgi:hypothetical protein